MLEVLTHAFNSEPLHTVRLADGRLCWVARQVGERIGYPANGRRFAQQILTDWADELRPGVDYEKLEGEDLDTYKRLSDQARDPAAPDRTAHLIVLFESGLYLALQKTRKPLGIKFRQFIAEQVMPQIARTGRFEPEAELPHVADRAELVPVLEARIAGLEETIGKMREALATFTQTFAPVLAAVQRDQAIAARAGGMRALPGAAPVMFEPPPGFHTLNALGRVLGVSARKAKALLVEHRMWDDDNWHRPYTVAIRNERGALREETRHWFSPDCRAELQRRGYALFEDGAEALARASTSAAVKSSSSQ